MVWNHFLGTGTSVITPMHVLPVWLLLAIAVISCDQRQMNSTAHDVPIDTSAILSAIDSLRSSYQGAVAAEDYAKLRTFVSKKAIMIQPGSSEWDSLRDDAQGPFPPGATIDIKPIEVQVMSNSWAYELGNSTVTYTPEGSEKAKTLLDTYLVIFKKTPDGWKVHREVASAYIPQDIKAEKSD